MYGQVRLFPRGGFGYRAGMATGTEHCVVYCTAPDSETARQLADLLVESQLAACVSILPGITSVYKWQGQVESSTEQLLMIKTRSDRFDALSQTIQQHHPYELPEIIAVPVKQGLTGYLRWIDENLINKP